MCGRGHALGTCMAEGACMAGGACMAEGACMARGHVQWWVGVHAMHTPN